MQAYVDGKQIEFAKDCGTWREAGYPTWCWNGLTSTYRIKPEPKLRPWTPVEAAGYLGQKIGPKGARVDHGTVKAVCGEGVDLVIDGKLYHRSFGVLLAEYVTHQSQPCGALEEPK